MLQQPARTRPRSRRLGVAAAAIVACVASTSVAHAFPLPVVDDLLTAVTCSGLFDDVPPELREALQPFIDTSSCHGSSDTTICTPADETCTVEVADEGFEDGSVQISVAGRPGPGGFMSLQQGRSSGTEACGLPLYVPTTVRFESLGVTDLVASHRISKPVDQDIPQNGAGMLQVCYASPKPFTTADGTVGFVGLLPDCDDARVAPCVISKRKNKADAIVEFAVPDGDPFWKLVTDLSKGTG